MGNSFPFLPKRFVACDEVLWVHERLKDARTVIMLGEVAILRHLFCCLPDAALRQEVRLL